MTSAVVFAYHNVGVACLSALLRHGVAIKLVVTHQDKQLTVNTNAEKFLEGLLHPGIKAYPLFLDPNNRLWVLHVKFAAFVNRLKRCALLAITRGYSGCGCK